MPHFPSCLLIVTAEVDPHVEDEWNRWYDSVHLPDALRCPGVRSGRRYISTGPIAFSTSATIAWASSGEVTSPLTRAMS